MSGWKRKLRGIIGTGVTWAFGWGALGGLAHLVARLAGAPGFFDISLAGDLLVPTAMGFLGGTFFSIGFALTEGRRTLAEIKVSRGALWGSLAGLVGPVVVAIVGASAGAAQLASLLPLLLGLGVFGGIAGGTMTAVARAEGRRLLERTAGAAAGALE